MDLFLRCDLINKLIFEIRREVDSVEVIKELEKAKDIPYIEDIRNAFNFGKEISVEVDQSFDLLDSCFDFFVRVLDERSLYNIRKKTSFDEGYDQNNPSCFSLFLDKFSKTEMWRAKIEERKIVHIT